MSDVAIAALLLGLMIGLAITAPIWGYDSRDGIESDQAARRIVWMQPRGAGVSGPRLGGTTRVAGRLAAGALRSVAYHLDADAATDERMNGRAARLY